jgi:hypothetical protein
MHMVRKQQEQEHPTGKLISTWAQVDPNELIWSQTFLWDQVGDNLIPNIHDI